MTKEDLDKTTLKLDKVTKEKENLDMRIAMLAAEIER